VICCFDIEKLSKEKIFGHFDNESKIVQKKILVCTRTLEDDVVGRQNCGCIIPQTVTHSLVVLKMGKIIARNMLS